MITRIAAIAILATVAIGCSVRQQAPTFLDSTNGIAYRLGAYNDILAVTVQKVDSGKILWKLERDISFAWGPTRFEKFDYANPPENMREAIPAQSLKVGDRVIVEVKYQYDQALAASVSGIRSEFEVVDANTFKRVAGD
jgi:hypothetical protein